MFFEKQLIMLIQVLIGEHDTSDSIVDRRDVMKITNHPKYENEEGHYDVAILYLSSSIIFSDTIAPICLPTSTQSLYTGQVATVTGWGLTSHDGSSASTLQEVELDVISNEACRDYYPGKIDRFEILEQSNDLSVIININLFFDRFHICAGGDAKGSCQGDSGGPLMLLENGRYKYKYTF